MHRLDTVQWLHKHFCSSVYVNVLVKELLVSVYSAWGPPSLLPDPHPEGEGQRVEL